MPLEAALSQRNHTAYIHFIVPCFVVSLLALIWFEYFISVEPGTEIAYQLMYAVIGSLVVMGFGGLVAWQEYSLVRSNKLLVQYAYYDGLTKIPNRRLGYDRLQHAIDRAHREGSKVALLFIDLDNFKYVNDTLGHDAGDSLLKEIVLRLQHCLRAEDTLVRLGGDEFAVILENVHEIASVGASCGRILEALASAVVIGSHQHTVTASIGVAVFPGDGSTVPQLLQNADLAMYRAKETGKNTYHFFSSSLSDVVHARFALEEGIRGATAHKEFFLQYQPKVELCSGKIIGFEALIRWQRGDEVVCPQVFIPCAESAGLISRLGHYALHMACNQMQIWIKEGVDFPRISVNISPKHFQDGERIVEDVRSALELYEVPPEKLEIELTESAVLEYPEAAVSTLYALKEMGVRVSLDDFGTGYSSLSMVHKFCIDVIKLDQSFVRHIDTDTRMAIVVKAIIAMADSLSLEVVAEGIETQAQYDWLVKLGCKRGQGFLFSRPVSTDTLPSLLTKNLIWV